MSGNIWGRKIPRGVCTVVRKYATTLKGTVMRDFKEILADNNIDLLMAENKTDRTYMYSGRMVEFIGADDQHKLKGGKRNILYINEANEVDYKTEFFQLIIRTKDIILLDFNPDDPDVYINVELELKRAVQKQDVEVIVSTYKDNPFLTREEVSEIENIQNVDPQLWTVYGQGGYGKVTGTIYSNREVIPELPNEAKYVGHGLDWWYTNDPTALLWVYLYNGCLVIDEEIYERGLTNVDIYDSKGQRVNNNPSIDGRMVEAGINKNLATIIGDSSEPKSIAELENLERDIRAVIKWADSVLFGIGIVGRYKILVTARSKGAISELRKYKRAVDKHGNTLNKPIDKFNHAMDAIRYVCMELLGVPKGEPDIYITDEEQKRMDAREKKAREDMGEEPDIF